MIQILHFGSPKECQNKVHLLWRDRNGEDGGIGSAPCPAVVGSPLQLKKKQQWT